MNNAVTFSRIFSEASRFRFVLKHMSCFSVNDFNSSKVIISTRYLIYCDIVTSIDKRDCHSKCE